MQWLKDHIMQFVVIIVITLIAIVLGVALRSYISPAQTITTMPQQTAETPAGTKQAAEAAHITIDTGQAKEAAQQIKEIRTTEQVPVYIVQSTGATVEKDTIREQKNNHADYSIVTAANTSKSSPQNTENLTSEAVDLSKIKDTDQVILNQYNVQAYKKQLNTVSYAPQSKIVGYEHSWKVSKSGQYVGVGVDYDIDDKKVYAKLTYTW